MSLTRLVDLVMLCIGSSIARQVDFGSVIRYFGSVIRYFGSVIRYFGSVIRYFGSVIRYFAHKKARKALIK